MASILTRLDENDLRKLIRREIVTLPGLAANVQVQIHDDVTLDEIQEIVGLACQDQIDAERAAKDKPPPT